MIMENSPELLKDKLDFSKIDHDFVEVDQGGVATSSEKPIRGVGFSKCSTLLIKFGKETTFEHIDKLDPNLDQRLAIASATEKFIDSLDISPFERAKLKLSVINMADNYDPELISKLDLENRMRELNGDKKLNIKYIAGFEDDYSHRVSKLTSAFGIPIGEDESKIIDRKGYPWHLIYFPTENKGYINIPALGKIESFDF